MKNKILFTSESVGAGHPDKICDQISDAILDEVLKQDNKGRVACEVFASNRLIVIGGEITTKAEVDYKKVAWEVLKPLGYNENDFTILCNVNKQSSDIDLGVSKDNNDIGAGDQGIMFGYATNETPEFMPLSITLSHELVKRAESLRKSGLFEWAKSDMKSQVTIDYTDEKNVKIDTVLLSVQHDENYNEQEFKKFIEENIVNYVVDKYLLNKDYKLLINPTGRFVIGGPVGDTGLTGRKIIVDTYGGFAHHGGGAFSGKDATKVDRSGAYVCRWIAKNLVAAGICDAIEIQVSYAIGIPQPTSIAVELKNSKYTKDEVLSCIKRVFDLRPRNIINELELDKAIYKQTATFGHFGRNDLNLAWEKLNKVEDIRKYFEKRV